MNFIYIAPHFPESFHQFAIALAKQGVNLLGIGQDSYDDLSEAMKAAFTEYFRVADITDEDEVRRAVAFLFYRHGPIDRIESFKAEYLPFEADLREQFHIPGPKPRDVVRFQSWAKMTTYLQKAEVHHVQGIRVRTQKQLERATAGRPFPIYVRPDDIADSRQLVFQDPSQLEAFGSHWDETTPYVVLDALPEGESYCYQGLVDAKGQLIYEKVAHQVQAGEECGANVWVISPHLDVELQALAKRVISTFKIKGRFVTLRLTQSPEGEWCVVGVTPVPLLNYGIDALNFTDNIDLYATYADIALAHQVAPIATTTQIGVIGERLVEFPARYSAEAIATRFAPAARLVTQWAGREALIFVTDTSATQMAVTEALLSRR